MDMDPWGESGLQQRVAAAATDKDINFYCPPVFYLSPFGIENLGRFGARSSLASTLKRGQTWPSFV